MKKDPAGTATISGKVSSAGFGSGAAMGGSSAGAGIALASAINTAAMPAM